MGRDEIEAFANHWASPETATEVVRGANVARDDWARRLRSPIELSDLRPWVRRGGVGEAEALDAAVAASLELAIVVTLWPERTDQVLRTSWDR